MDLVKTGINLLGSGYSVIPIGDAKKPVGSWKSNQDRQCTQQELTMLLSNPKVSGLGVVCGFNGLEVVDVDLKVLKDKKDQIVFWRSFLSMLRDNIEGFDEKFSIYQTMSGGYHILYRCNVIEGNRKLARTVLSPEAILETRGVGGYVKVYENCIGGIDYANVKTVTEHDRTILIEICNSFDGYNPTPDQEEITPWKDYDNKVQVWDLVSDEFTKVGENSKEYLIKRHGAESDHSGYLYKDNGFMYLFSTGTAYPAQTLLRPFSVYTIKHHGGDWKAAGKELYRLGYGSRSTPRRHYVKREEVTEQQFPLDIFPVFFREYIQECNKTLGFSVDYMGCSLLWLTSLAIGNTIKVSPKTGYTDICSVWIAVVGSPGVGKTPSVKAIIRPLMDLNYDMIESYNESRKEYDAMMKLDKNKRSEEVAEPIRSQMVVGDITLESLADIHQNRPQGIGVFKDELAGWFKDMNKYNKNGGGEIEQWLSMWSGEGISVNRKTSRDAFVRSAFVPVLGGIQPDVLENIFTEDFKTNGFADRMLLCYPELTVPHYASESMDQMLISSYDSAVREMFALLEKIRVKNDRLVLRLEEEAMVEFRRFHARVTDIENGDTENEYMKSMLPKMKQYILRFALILQTLDSLSYHDEIYCINKDNILRAEALCNYFITMAKKVKVRAIDKRDMKAITRVEGKSSKDKCMEIWKMNSKFNKKQAAELLDVTRQTIANWVKEFEA
jgi:hypothetical protein